VSRCPLGRRQGESPDSGGRIKVGREENGNRPKGRFRTSDLRPRKVLYAGKRVPFLPQDLVQGGRTKTRSAPEKLPLPPRTVVGNLVKKKKDRFRTAAVTTTLGRKTSSNWGGEVRHRRERKERESNNEKEKKEGLSSKGARPAFEQSSGLRLVWDGGKTRPARSEES